MEFRGRGVLNTPTPHSVRNCREKLQISFEISRELVRHVTILASSLCVTNCIFVVFFLFSHVGIPRGMKIILRVRPQQTKKKKAVQHCTRTWQAAVSHTNPAAAWERGSCGAQGHEKKGRRSDYSGTKEIPSRVHNSSPQGPI